MASYRPSVAFEVPEPCGESWEAMEGGGARARRCAKCEHDVLNLAAMSPAEIEAILAGPGPLPCVRMARFEDGSLMVAEAQRARPAYGMMAGVAVAALVTLSSAAAGQAPHRTMGKMVPRVSYSGLVLRADGKPAVAATVYLTRMVDGAEQRSEVKTDASGKFAMFVMPGEWHVGANGGDGTYSSGGEVVVLSLGHAVVAKPMTLRPVTVTAGVPLPVTPKTDAKAK